MRKTILASSVLLIASTFVLASTPARVAQGAINPCPNQDPASIHDGAQTTAQLDLFGARSDIEFDSPALCGTDAVFSTAWAMVWATNTNYGPDGWGWAQMGYGNFSANTFPQHSGYWEWGQTVKGCTRTLSSCSPIVNSWGNHPSGVTRTYSVRHMSDGHFHLFVDGNLIYETMWNPTVQWVTNWRAAFYAETKYRESDTVGTVSDPVSFTHNQKYQNCCGGGWVDTTQLSGGGDIPIYKFDWITQGSTFKVWTDRS
jgi:hypothetical protein